MFDIFSGSWQILAVSSPWLLFGFLAAGLIHIFLPKSFIEKQLKTPGIFSVLKASALGLPLPLCSCSVIPVGISLRKSGASRGATAGFLISTPEIGVDSFLLSYTLLGPLLAFARIITSFVSATIVGSAIDLFGGEDKPNTTSNTHSCCKNKQNSCDDNSITQATAHPINMAYRALRYGFIDVVDDLSRLLLLGFLLAGIVTALIPETSLGGDHFNNLPTLFFMLLVSLPVYVCATGLTPLAAALLAKGLSPGAALVFLLAGPATNISTMLVVYREFGRKSLAIYVSGISTFAILSGWVFNLFFEQSGMHSTHLFSLHSGEHLSMLQLVSGILLFSILLASIIKRAYRSYNLCSLPSTDSSSL